MNRLQYVVATILILAVVPFMSGCGNASSETKSNETAGDGPLTKSSAKNTTSGKGEDPKTNEKNAEKKDDKKKDTDTGGKTKFITFDDLLINIPAETQYRPVMMKEEVQALDGKYVSIPGEFLPGTDRLKGIKEFVLGRNAKCKFGPDGQADHVIRVFMNEWNSTEYTDQRIEVAGLLKIVVYNGPAGYTWSIYEMHADKVSKHRKSQRQ